MPDNGSLFYSSGGGTINLFGSFASDAAFVAAVGPAQNGFAYYNTSAGTIRAFQRSAWRFIDAGVAAQLIHNLAFTAAVATNAMTVAFKSQLTGNDPDASNTVTIAFRNSTATNGQAGFPTLNSASSITIPSGTTIGTQNGVQHYIYIYAINNSGAIEPALSLSGDWDEGALQTTVAISGGTSATTLYSTTARSNVPIRLVGRISISQATAGTWASSPTELCAVPFMAERQVAVGAAQTVDGTTTSATYAAFTNNPTVTFVARRTKIYKVWGSLTVTGSAAASAGLTRIAVSSGSPTTVFSQECRVDQPAAAGGLPSIHSPYILARCVAGTSYTFRTEGRVTSGTLTLSSSLVGNGHAIIAEEWN